MNKITWILLAAVAMTGCASTTANLQRETARFIGNVLPDAVTVSNIDRGATSVKWDAAIKDAAYNCFADDMVRRVNCVKK